MALFDELRRRDNPAGEATPMHERMRSVTIIRVAALLLIAAAGVVLARCTEAEPGDERRQSAILARADTSAGDAIEVVRLQRELLNRLAARQSIEKIVTADFVVRREYAPVTETDSVKARLVELFRTVNIRPPLDTAALAVAGDLTSYADFEALPLSARQLVVLAQRPDGPVLLTNWLRSSAGWRAVSITVGPSEWTLATLERARSQRARR